MVRTTILFLIAAPWLLPACGGTDGGDDAAAPDVVDTLEATPDACVPSCGADNECGSDGCGSFCGVCKGLQCKDNHCVACDPLDCGGIECGFENECGESCGECTTGQFCSFAGTCTTDPCLGVDAAGCCEPGRLLYCQGDRLERLSCSPRSCGWNAEFGAYDCGDSTDADPSGAHPRDCADLCVPDCTGRACGDDGCGGSCGTCGGDTVCEPASGTCASCLPDCTDRACGDDGCGGSCGDCVGALAYCAGGACQCSAQCAGRICGDDGCGGTCGTCEAGFTCHEGGCECAPQCDGKSCGPDGCGNLCGVCDGGCACDDGGLCVPPAGSALENGCDGTVRDPATGLVWQQAFGGSREFGAARVLCDNLATAGHDDWRLPGIDELRTLIVGCPATAGDGPCPIHDGCTSTTCDSPDCAGCALDAGPGPAGAYLDPAFEPDLLQTWFWSVTQLDATEDPAFVVEFDKARVHWYVTSVTKMGVRCVRGSLD